LSERPKRDCPELYFIEDLLVEAEVLHQRLEVIVLFFKLRQATQFSKPKPASFFQR
jgi:hypothetical protein